METAAVRQHGDALRRHHLKRPPNMLGDHVGRFDLVVLYIDHAHPEIERRFEFPEEIEILSPAEMEKKYGKPPGRLANLPWHAPKTFLAVANLSGHAGVAVIAASPKGWRVVGYHD